MSINLQWDGKMGFAGDAPSGARIVLDAHPESGGSGTGPTPVEALVASVAACSAMDVISILQKKRQEVSSYTVEVSYERRKGSGPARLPSSAFATSSPARMWTPRPWPAASS
jgi:putative redox protein